MSVSSAPPQKLKKKKIPPSPHPPSIPPLET